jgi:hypothetical protein
VERGEHAGHGGAARGSPRKLVTGEALRWRRSIGIPTTAVAPVDFGGRRQSLRLDKVYGSELGQSHDDEKLGRAELTVMGGWRRLLCKMRRWDGSFRSSLRTLGHGEI